ncbi:hypothetical protein AOPFMNJM_1511 [Methylobacterium jeotgali]|uniref:Uncharacterized protein n=1 Tax=Methylobacterium jeotgali TaxID=381630 RepID=A0ABQ4SSL2_9HYPH|nr:hypothetical protein AOPFMNJM_1511 [Methylobacterium jeotgali]
MPSPAVPVSLASAIRGTEGAIESIVRASAALAAPVLPAASVAVAVRLWAPSARVPGVKLQRPSAEATVSPSRTPASSTVTVAPASAVPLRVGLRLAVIPSPAVPVSGVKPVIAGASGATRSTAWAVEPVRVAGLPAASITSLVPDRATASVPVPTMPFTVTT